MAIKVSKELQCPTENYIIFHHIPGIVDKNKPLTLTIPVDPENISDSMGASFAENIPLSRSAPIYSYQHSGPRTVTIQLDLHRDLFREFNMDLSKYNPNEDAVDLLVKCLDAAVLPDYDSAGKIVNPPIVSLKIRDEIYIKGVINGSVNIGYNPPVLNIPKLGTRYAMVNVGFTISEITPYNASIIKNIGKVRK